MNCRTCEQPLHFHGVTEATCENINCKDYKQTFKPTAEDLNYISSEQAKPHITTEPDNLVVFKPRPKTIDELIAEIEKHIGPDGYVTVSGGDSPYCAIEVRSDGVTVDLTGSVKDEETLLECLERVFSKFKQANLNVDTQRI